MTFWILFALLLTLLFVLQQLLKNEYKPVITKIAFFVLWFVSSFRYMIGADYEQYMTWYELALDNPIMEIILEPSFLLILRLLHFFGFTYQVMFLLYATITLIMIYKGLCYYVSSQRQLLATLIGFAFFYDGFFYTMNNIRAAAALSILFYGTRYVYERNLKKFGVILCIAFFFHYSALLFFPVYFIRFIQNKRIAPLNQMLLIGLSFLAGYTLFISRLFLFAISYMETYALKYGSLIVGEKGSWSMSSTIVFCGLVFLIYLYTVHQDMDSKQIFINNMALLYVMLLIIFNIEFSETAYNLTDICHRIPLFFVPFFFIGVGYSICSFWEKKSSLIAIFLVCICMFQFIRVIYYMPMSDAARTSPRLSIGNINYEFNFDLLK